MVFGILLFVSFIVGILIGIPTSQFVRSKSPLITFFLFVPFLFLFLFSDNPLVDQIRYMLLCVAIGILCYWSYIDTKVKKNKGS